MRKEFYIPIIGIIVAELLMFPGNSFILYGLGIHAVNIIAIILMITLSSIKLEEKNLLQGLTLIILLRIINVSMPQLFTIDILQYSLIYSIMILPVYFVVKNQHISFEELGVDFKKLYIYLPLAIIIATIVAIIEYKILSPDSIIESINIPNIVLITIVMFVFVGSVEEIMFRSIIYTRMEKIVDPNYGIVLSGVLFGVMYASYGVSSGVIIAILFGIVLSYIFQRTRSLPFIVMIRGIANVIVLGVLPHILLRT